MPSDVLKTHQYKCNFQNIQGENAGLPGVLQLRYFLILKLALVYGAAALHERRWQRDSSFSARRTCGGGLTQSNGAALQTSLNFNLSQHRDSPFLATKLL